MNAWYDYAFAWFADYYLLATILLAVVLAASPVVRQPARRIAIAWSTAGALLLMAVLVALPGWSVVHLFEAAPPRPELLAHVPVESAPDPLKSPRSDFELIPTYQAEQSAEQTATVIPTRAAVPAIEITQFNWNPYLLAPFATGCIAMFAWLVVGVWQTNRMLRRAVPAPAGLEQLLTQLDPATKSQLRLSSLVGTGVALGLRRPTILLPKSYADSYDHHALRSVLAHELAHLKHGDLWLLAILRMLMVPLWAHPLYWLARRRVRLDQEMMADAAAAELAGRSTYAAQLVGWARELNSSPPKLAGAVGLWETKSQLRRRITVLLDEKLTILRNCSRRWKLSVVAICATAAVGLSLLTVQPASLAEENTDGKTESQAAFDEALNSSRKNLPTQKSRPFRFTLVSPDGTPVEGAALDIRTDITLNFDQVSAGEFVSGGKYGAAVKTDARGAVVLDLAENPKRLSIGVKHPGYGPYWAQWSSGNHPLSLPEEFTAKLEAGWSIGGVVIDAQGAPVAGATIGSSVKYKMRPGDSSSLGVGSNLLTDSEGKWRFDSVPQSMNEVFITVDHANFKPLRRPITRDLYGLELDEEPAETLELEQGLIVTGTVTDEKGIPLQDALVRTEFLNEQRESRTDSNGAYRLIGCEPGMARIVVSAEGKALDLKEIRIDDETGPVDFTMEPGGHVRIRVVDANGEPIPKARVFFQRWRGPIDYFEFDHVNGYADDQGVWEWNEAPLDEFQADICPPDGMQLTYQPIVARDKEYVFQPPPPLVVGGKVVDARTKKPVKQFKVIPGLRNKNPQIRMNWIEGDSYEATNGEYSTRFSRMYPAHLVRIEADGYEVAISRDIAADEGAVTVDFELTPAKDISLLLIDDEGNPASGAKVALGVAGSQISVANGEIDDGSTYASRIDADQAGRVSFPARTEPFQVVVTHSRGFAHLKSSEGPIPHRIQLTPWARAEGTYRVGAEIAPEVTMTILALSIDSYGAGVPRISTHYKATTDGRGRFLFERVFPGKGRIARDIVLMVDEGALEVTSSLRVSAEFVAGKTTRVDVGGTGQPVIGRIVAPDGHPDKVFWNFALVMLSPWRPGFPLPPVDVKDDPVKLKAWQIEWAKANELRRASLPYARATIDSDGKFRIDDMSAGEYDLSIRFSKHSAGQLRKRISIPEIKGELTDRPHDLGTLLLEEPKPAETKSTERASSEKATLVANAASLPPTPPRTEFNLVNAKHMMLLDGREFITWPEIEASIGKLEDPGKAYMRLWFTKQANEEFAQAEANRLYKKFGLRGMSIGRVAPRTSFRYDQLETVLDLEPNAEHAVSGMVTDTDGNPVAGAEVVVAEPVDESIGYKTIGLYVVDGKLRSQIDEVISLTDRQGKFAVYPSSDEVKHYLVVMHPEAGFALVQRTGREPLEPITLSPWASIAGTILPRDDMEQRASVSTSIPAADGWPEVSMTHFEPDRRDRKDANKFEFLQIPPKLKTVFRRVILKPQGTSISLPTRELELQPGEQVELEIGEFNETEKLHYDLYESRQTQP